MLDTNAPPLFAVKSSTRNPGEELSSVLALSTEDVTILRRISHGQPSTPLNKAVVTLVLQVDGKLRAESIMFYPLKNAPRRSPELPNSGTVLAIRHPVAGNIIGVGWIPVGRNKYYWRYTKQPSS